MIITKPEAGTVTFYMFCIDPRFRKAHNAFLETDAGATDYLDDIRYPGGAGDLGALRTALEVGVRHHGVTRAVLSVHEDCAAGARAADLAAAAQAARELGVADVELVLFKLDGTREAVREADGS